MSLEQTLSADIVTAMKAKDATKLTALRMLKSALTNKSIEKGRALDGAEELQVVSMLVKQRRDSIEQFTKGGRKDLADKEEAEIGFLNAYQPAAASDEDVAAAVAAAIAETGATERERHGQSHEGDDGCTRREDCRWQEGQRGREGEARLTTSVHLRNLRKKIGLEPFGRSPKEDGERLTRPFKVIDGPSGQNVCVVFRVSQSPVTNDLFIRGTAFQRRTQLGMLRLR